uniref:Uncharacterized protein n=1 Tax=Lactuca sativa TaxID=4236 RepID=A0A9R1WZ58_LACSA|nr:hypothetical protein LSAT_V11C800397390 [Lactuca sativa]
MAVAGHIVEVFSYHEGKKCFLAPYLQGDHWVLFILCPNSKSAYILDSSKNDQKKLDEYLFVSLISTIFPGRFDKSEKCYKQKGMVLEMIPRLIEMVNDSRKRTQ